MNRLEHLLTISAEECNEVAHRISKALRFGLNEIQPGQYLTNGQRIILEFHELLAIVEILMDEYPQHLYTGPWLPPLDDKKARVEEFLKLSAKCGTLSEEVNEMNQESASTAQQVLLDQSQELARPMCTICKAEIGYQEVIYSITDNHYDCEFPVGQKNTTLAFQEAEAKMESALGRLQTLPKYRRA